MKLVRWKDSRELFWDEAVEEVEHQMAVNEYGEEPEPLFEPDATDIDMYVPTEEDEDFDDRRDSIFVQGDIF